MAEKAANCFFFIFLGKLSKFYLTIVRSTGLKRKIIIVYIFF